MACRKPHKQEFIRVRVGEENRFTTCTFTDKDSRETYLVSPAVRDHLVGDVVPNVAVGRLSEPDWSTVPSISELLKLSFKDRFIGSTDHPVLKRLRGEV